MEALDENHYRFPRKVATLQLNRYWSRLRALAEQKAIPLDKLVVRLEVDNYPFKFSALDSRDPKECEYSPYFSMIEDGNSRRPREGFHCGMLVLTFKRCNELPCMPYHDNTSLKVRALENTSANVSDIGYDGASYVDGDGNALVPDFDSLCEIIHRVRAKVTKESDTIWVFSLDDHIATEINRVLGDVGT